MSEAAITHGCICFLPLEWKNAELQQISFTSYGKDTFSSISLLIDSLCVQHAYISKSVADSALVTFVQTLKLTSEQKEDLTDLLDKKYMVTSIKGLI